MECHSFSTQTELWALGTQLPAPKIASDRDDAEHRSPPHCGLGPPVPGMVLGGPVKPGRPCVHQGSAKQSQSRYSLCVWPRLAEPRSCLRWFWAAWRRYWAVACGLALRSGSTPPWSAQLFSRVPTVVAAEVASSQVLCSRPARPGARGRGLRWSH